MLFEAVPAPIHLTDRNTSNNIWTIDLDASMEALLELDEAALSKGDHNGFTPLHHFMMYNEDAEVTAEDIEKILAIDPDAFGRKTTA